MRNNFRKLRAALDAARAELDAERRADARGLLVAISVDDEAAEGREPGAYGSELVYTDEADLERRLAAIPAPEECARAVVMFGPAHISPPADMP